jgi:hypothetical protein
VWQTLESNARTGLLAVAMCQQRTLDPEQEAAVLIDSVGRLEPDRDRQVPADQTVHGLVVIHGQSEPVAVAGFSSCAADRGLQ